MKFFNESSTDRRVRAIGGIVLVAIALAVSSTAAGVTLVVLGAMALGTSAVGWCPAYSLLGISTLRRVPRCPHCDAREGTSYN